MVILRPCSRFVGIEIVRETDRLQPLLYLAGLKIVVAIAVLVAALAAPDGLEASRDLGGSLSASLLLAQIAALAAAGTLLVVGGRHDRRAVHLGYVCLLLAAAFAPHATLGLHLTLPYPASALVFALANLRVEIFLAPLVCLFVRDFPSVPMSFRMQSWVDRAIRVSWIVAGALGAGHLFWLLGTLAPGAARRDAWQDPFYLPSALAVAACALAAIAFLEWKTYRSRGDERRRGRVLLLTMAGGAVFALAALLILLGGDAGIAVPAPTRRAAVLAVHAVLVAIPFAIAYAVLVKRILDVRGIARQAVERTLTRATARLVVAAPFVFVAIYLFEHRELSLVELLSARHLVLPVMVVVGVAGLAYRRQILDAVDRQLFPAQYRARRILDGLAGRLRGARDLEHLTELIGEAVGGAWRLDRLAILVREAGSGLLVDRRNELPPLDLGSELVDALIEKREPLAVDLAAESSALRRLPEDERHWLVDGRVRLLVPTFATDHAINALIVLGAKRGELRFLAEELRLLAGVAAAAGLIVEILELRSRATAGQPLDVEASGDELDQEILSSDSKAGECLSCGRIYPAGTPKCRKCNLELGEALVPYALRRNFRFEERIGVGGMAVVYRATDLKLGRSVAIKTLPRVSPEAAMRLQHEARTAATVSHPGLAAIYGIETWGGTPMLILEYLEGGTLSQRLLEEPLAVAEVIETGQIVAQALEAIHALGILHRDVKPSNVGYTRHGDAKLLDFGISRIYHDLRQDDEDPSEILTVDGRMMHYSENITGTLCYFSPEALDDKPPDPTFDLWSLTVVLYEALTARNLFFRPRMKDMLRAIREAEVPDPRDLGAGCPAELVSFFELELHPDRSRRSQSGREFHQRLERVRRGLAARPQETSGRPRPTAVDVASS